MCGFYSVEKLEIQENEKIPKPLAYFCPNNALSNGCFGRKNPYKNPYRRHFVAILHILHEVEYVAYLKNPLKTCVGICGLRLKAHFGNQTLE
jgi:hypothetical protein